LALELWVDDQRIPVAGAHNCSVLSGDSVCREAFSLPDGLLGWGSEDSEWVNALSEWNLLLNNVIKPDLLPKVVPVCVREWTNVRDESG